LATASTTRPAPEAAAAARPFRLLRDGSLTRRMLAVAGLWIATLLLIGGFALDRVLTATITRNFDAQLTYALNAMITAAEIGPDGEVLLSRGLVDQRFDQSYSGLYFQVSANGEEPFRSRSLWDRALKPDLSTLARDARAYTSSEFPDEPLRIVERDALIPGSPVSWRFQVAGSRADLDQQIADLRRTLTWSLSVLGLGLLILAALQATYGLWPLRRVSRSIVAIRSGYATRIPTNFPPEIAPLVTELNALLEHNERQAEEARTHAGNLAHALKTPMSVLINEAKATAPNLPEAVLRETTTMKRHVDHHLARARAIGRRSASAARTEVWPSLVALQRAIERIHAERGVVIDVAGDKTLAFRGERQDLEEMLGNLVDNAAKYGAGRVFVTVGRTDRMVYITVEDDGPGIPVEARASLFQRGARLDTSKPGTGLGLAIVRDVAEIYGGSVELGESEDLGGLCVTLRLPECGGR